MTGGGAQGAVVYGYSMTVQMGLARGPINHLREIRVGEKTAWANSNPADPAPEHFEINQFYLFGGPNSEGGITGQFYLQQGRPDQLAHPELCLSMGIAQDQLPGYRGVATTVFKGMVSTTPYVKPWTFRIGRTTAGWEDDNPWHPELATIIMQPGDITAMNPAHILYECLTNYSWGRGIDRARLNEPRWHYTASVLYNEGFGLCMRWTRQDTLQEFIQQVIEHVGGALYVDRISGLINFDLIREETNLAAMPVLTYNTGLLEVMENEAPARDNAVNEMVVNYRDPVTNEERQARSHNLAGIQSTGATFSATKNYLGAPTYALAARLAQRDLRTQSGVTRRLKLKMDRRAWNIKPASVFIVNVPERGIFNFIMRAGRIQDGNVEKGEIIVDCVMDIFGTPPQAYLNDPTKPWSPPDTAIDNPDYAYVKEMTFREAIKVLGLANAQVMDPTTAMVKTQAARPNPLANGYTLASLIEGGVVTEYSDYGWSPALILASAIGPYDTSVSIATITESGRQAAGAAYQIGDEVVRLDDLNRTTMVATITRGCDDTIPRAHGAGEALLMIDNAFGTDGQQYAIGENYEARMLVRGSVARLTWDQATPHLIAPLIGRAHLPLPPAAMRLNGVPVYSLSPSDTTGGDLAFTWSTRSRLIQKDALVGHFESSVAPETDQMTRVMLFDTAPGSTVPKIQQFIAGTSLTITATQLLAAGLTDGARVRIDSVRGPHASVQFYDFVIGLPVRTLIVPGALRPGVSFSRNSIATGY